MLKYKKDSHPGVIIVALLSMVILNLALMALTAWTFSVTGSAWSFAILLFMVSVNSKQGSTH